LTCLELQTGKLVWQRDTAADFKVPEAFFGVGSTPILEEGLLIVMVGGQPNSGLVAFDARTGQTVWESVGEANWEGVPMTGWPGEQRCIGNPGTSRPAIRRPSRRPFTGGGRFFA
jgi:outer membrane protein assembly factor BamB